MARTDTNEYVPEGADRAPGWKDVPLREFVHAGLLYYVNSKFMWPYGLALTVVKPGQRDSDTGWEDARLIITQTDPPEIIRSGRDDDMLDVAMEWLNARSTTLR